MRTSRDYFFVMLKMIVISLLKIENFIWKVFGFGFDGLLFLSNSSTPLLISVFELFRGLSTSFSVIAILVCVVKYGFKISAYLSCLRFWYMTIGLTQL